MKKFDGYVKKHFLFCLFIFVLPFFFQSCSSEKDIGASLDDFNLVHSGNSYPSASYDDGAFFFNMFAEFICDLAMISLDSDEQPEHANKINLMGKVQFIEKGSQNKFTGGKTVTKLGYAEIPLYALYQHKLSSGGKIFGGVGPYVSYGVTGKIKYPNSSVKAFSQTGGFKRFDAGASLLAGFKTPAGVGVSLAYEYGFANIAVTNAGGDKIKNRGFSLNLSYDLDKIIHKTKK